MKKTKSKTPESESGQSSPKGLIIGIIVVVVIVALGAGYYYMSKNSGGLLSGLNNSENTGQEKPMQPIPFNLEVSSWEDYNSRKLGLNFKRPESWEFIVDPSGNLIIQSHEDCKYFVGENVVSGCYVIGLIMSEDENPDVSISEDEGRMMIDKEPSLVSEEIEVAGVKAVKEMTDDYFLVQLKNEGKKYNISGDFSPKDKDNFTKLLEEFLASISF